MNKMQLQMQEVDDYLEYKADRSSDWKQNVESLLKRVVLHYDFHSKSKKITTLRQIFGECKKNSLKFYLNEVIRYLKWLTNYNSFDGTARINQEVLKWDRGNNFIADLLQYRKESFRKSVDGTDKKKKYSVDNVGKEIELIMKLDIPEYYKRMCRLVFFMNPRRRKAVVNLFMEHINAGTKTITFYEKDGREFEVEFAPEDFSEILQWKKERMKIKKEVFAIHPDTGEKGRPLFLNEHGTPVTRNGVSVYFSLLKKRPICKYCYGFVNKKSKKCMKCGFEYNNIEIDPLYSNFNFHLGRGGHASRLLDEGFTLTEVAHFGGWKSIQVLRDNYDASDRKRAVQKILETRKQR